MAAGAALGFTEAFWTPGVDFLPPVLATSPWFDLPIGKNKGWMVAQWSSVVVWAHSPIAHTAS